MAGVVRGDSWKKPKHERMPPADEETGKRVGDRIRAGERQIQAACNERIAPNTHRAWMAQTKPEYRHYQIQVTIALEEMATAVITKGDEHADKANGPGVTWATKRLQLEHRDRYSEKSSLELSGDKDNPLQFKAMPLEELTALAKADVDPDAEAVEHEESSDEG